MKHEYIKIGTSEYNQMIRISEQVEEIIQQSKLQNGVVTVQTLHTTTGILVNESLECLESDILDFFGDLVPETRNYAHARMLHDYGSTAGNPTGHLKSILTGDHCHVYVKDGKITKGSAQEIYFMEYDGPSQRNILIQINDFDK